MRTIDDETLAAHVFADPYAYYGRLREEDPVHWNDRYKLWLITRHEDVVWVTRHDDLWSSELPVGSSERPRKPYPPVDEGGLKVWEQNQQSFWSEIFIHFDRPEHPRMRKVVHGDFTPRSIEGWRMFVRSVIKEILDGLDSSGSMDIMKDLATPLPLFVICEMMGIPRPDRPHIKRISEMLLVGDGAPEADRMLSASTAIEEVYRYLAPLVEERIASPGDDLISVLASGEKRDIFTRQQVLANAFFLLSAGHETTINLICNGVLAFIRHPDQWELLKQDPVAKAVMATEECLRYDSPVTGINRTTKQDVELHGKVLRKNDRVRWVIASANRDPRVFPEPDKFDILRSPNPHLAFGSGIHHCLGAHLARVEGQEVFAALAQRFSALKLTSDSLEYQPNITMRSLKALTVSW